MKLISLIFLTLFMQGAVPEPQPFNVTAYTAFKPYEGPTVEINVSEENADLIAIKDKNHQPMVIVSKGGKVTYGKDYKPDDGARTFWEVLAEAYPQVCHQEKQP